MSQPRGLHPPAPPCRVCEPLSHNGQGTSSTLLVSSAQHLLSPGDTQSTTGIQGLSPTQHEAQSDSYFSTHALGQVNAGVGCKAPASPWAHAGMGAALGSLQPGPAAAAQARHRPSLLLCHQHPGAGGHRVHPWSCAAPWALPGYS